MVEVEKECLAQIVLALGQCVGDAGVAVVVVRRKMFQQSAVTLTKMRSELLDCVG
jgi:hypothetical protein